MKNHIRYPGDDREARGNAEVAFSEISCDIAANVSRVVRAAALEEHLSEDEADTIAQRVFRYTYTVLNAVQWMDMPQVPEDDRLAARRGCIARSIQQAVYDDVDGMGASDLSDPLGEATFDAVWEELEDEEDDDEDA